MDAGKIYEIEFAIALVLGLEPERLQHPVIDIGRVQVYSKKLQRTFSPSTRWEDAGILKEHYCVGSEGGSAWVWLDGDCFGKCADTELEAITLTTWECIHRGG